LQLYVVGTADVFNATGDREDTAAITITSDIGMRHAPAGDKRPKIGVFCPEAVMPTPLHTRIVGAKCRRAKRQTLPGFRSTHLPMPQFVELRPLPSKDGRVKSWGSSIPRTSIVHAL
jgi:hypothetical protein